MAQDKETPIPVCRKIRKPGKRVFSVSLVMEVAEQAGSQSPDSQEPGCPEKRIGLPPIGGECVL